MDMKVNKLKMKIPSQKEIIMNIVRSFQPDETFQILI